VNLLNADSPVVKMKTLSPQTRKVKKRDREIENGAVIKIQPAWDTVCGSSIQTDHLSY